MKNVSRYFLIICKYRNINQLNRHSQIVCINTMFFRQIWPVCSPLPRLLRRGRGELYEMGKILTRARSTAERQNPRPLGRGASHFISFAYQCVAFGKNVSILHCNYLNIISFGKR